MPQVVEDEDPPVGIVAIDEDRDAVVAALAFARVRHRHGGGDRGAGGRDGEEQRCRKPSARSAQHGARQQPDDDDSARRSRGSALASARLPAGRSRSGTCRKWRRSYRSPRAGRRATPLDRDVRDRGAHDHRRHRRKDCRRQEETVGGQDRRSTPRRCCGARIRRSRRPGPRAWPPDRRGSAWDPSSRSGP